MRKNTKNVGIKTSIVLNFFFPKSTISSSFFFFFLMINLYFLISAMILKTFNLTAELVIPTGAQINVANG